MADDKTDANALTHETVRDGVEAFWRSTADLRTNTKESFEFVVGGVRQWKAEDISKLTEQQRPVMSFNLCQDKINFLSGYQSDREQDYRYFPRGSEDEAVGRLGTSMVKYAMDQAEGAHSQHQQFRKGIIGGQQVMEIGHAYEYCDDLVEGEISMDVLPENSWACDIGARRYDRNDAQWQAKLMWMTRDAMNRKFKGKAEHWTVGSGLWAGSSADPSTTGVADHMIAEYFDKASNRIRLMQYWYRKPIEIALLANRQTGDVQRFATGKDAEAYLKRMIDDEGMRSASQYTIQPIGQVVNLVNRMTGASLPLASEEDGQQQLDMIRRQAGAAMAAQFSLIKRDATALRVAHCTAWELIEDGPSPYLDDWRFPFSPFTCYQDLDDYNSIKGIIEDIKDPQREYNWQYSTLLDIMVRGPKGGVWLDASMDARVPKLKQEYSRAGFMGTFTGNAPVPVAPQMFPPGLIDMIGFCMNEAMRITGLTGEVLGQTTQKTVSGRAIQARQSGALVGVASLLLNWMMTKKYQGQLLLRRVQQFYSVEKMLRIKGQDQQVAQALGVMGQAVMPDEMLIEQFKRLKQTDMDCVVGFVDASPTARIATANQLLQAMAAGFPIPPQIIPEVSDWPYKQEINAALAKQNNQLNQPNEALSKVLGAGQGQTAQPDGVNR